MKHSTLKKKALGKSGVKAAYDALEPEFDLLCQILLVRLRVLAARNDGKS